MKFLRIKYENYRCFKDLEVSFDVTDDKNISVIIAPNGGGKTEMLFSFWWVLYDFDFRTLKGKEDTPYSINSTLYMDLLNSNVNKQYDVSVQLEFEYENIVYRVKRTETYKKKNNDIIKSQIIELSTINENGSLSLPERDPDIVNKRLSKIIPIKILHGIIFDGERMKQLSSIDENSKVAVEGVIREITNEELFELCRGEFEDIKSSNSAMMRRVARQLKNSNLERIVSDLNSFEEDLKLKRTALKAKKDRLDEVKTRLNNVSMELKKEKDSQKYEEQRLDLKKRLHSKNSLLTAHVEDFYKSLADGHMLISNDLFEDVIDSIETRDIPLGLTVEAVKSIMKRSKCICGNDINDEVIHNLNELIGTLPPENINSTISEMVRQSKMHVDFIKTTISKSYKSVIEVEEDIKQIKRDIAHISTLITEGASERIKELEKEYNELIIEENKLIERDIPNLENTIKFNETKIDQLNKDKTNYSNISDDSLFYSTKDNFIRKCIKALDEIDEYNKKNSLANINSRINEAYSILSEDYKRGRRLYIVQYDESKKYRLVSYYLSKFQSMVENYEANGTMRTFELMNLNEDQIKEKIILQVLESNSTGQSKINTLAFAKAILDYSKEERDEDSTEITKAYPFLIDSPFTELSGENAEKSAANIHTFTNQIILMISRDSFASVEDNIRPYIGSVSELSKVENQNYSVLKGVE